MKANHYSLANRCNEFKTVVENTHCTDANQTVKNLEESMDKVNEQLIYAREQGSAIYVVGNGGSAAVASHAIIDFINVCQLRAFTLHESSVITCMANDFGYENAFARLAKTVMRPNDILIAISSSGKSANICNVAKTATEAGAIVITLSGFKADNPLRKLGDINFWLDSCDYGMVEIGHSFILHNMSDRIGFAMQTTSTEAQASVM